MRILFLHGRESGPSGTKARWLAARYDSLTPVLDTSSLETALPGAERALAEFGPDVVVGSSFGGGVALALAARGLWPGGTVLLAPAWRLLGLSLPLPLGEPAVVLHGRLDEVVPLADSRALVAGRGPGVILVETGDEHRLLRVLDDGTLEWAILRAAGGVI